jgi:hypothetical protein
LAPRSTELRHAALPFMVEDLYAVTRENVQIAVLDGAVAGHEWIRLAARSAMAYTVALVLDDTAEGMTEASTTRSPSIPRTRSSVSTTAVSSMPIRQVPA